MEAGFVPVDRWGRRRPACGIVSHEVRQVRQVFLSPLPSLLLSGEDAAPSPPLVGRAVLGKPFSAFGSAGTPRPIRRAPLRPRSLPLSPPTRPTDGGGGEEGERENE